MMLQIPRRILKDECSTEDSSESGGESDVREPEEEEDEHGLLEDWVTWVWRATWVRMATRIAEAELEKAQVTDWAREQRKRYWDLQTELLDALTSDGPIQF